MTDAEKKSASIRLAQGDARVGEKERVSERKRDDDDGREKGEKKGRTRARKSRRFVPAVHRDVAILYISCAICIPFARSFIKTSRTERREICRSIRVE